MRDACSSEQLTTEDVCPKHGSEIKAEQRRWSELEK